MKISEVRSFSQMEDFCRNDVLSCVLGFSDMEAETFHLLTEKELGILEIAEELDRDRSTAQRIVKKLISTGLISRRAISLKKGRKFRYTAIPPSNIKQRLREELDQFCNKIGNQIDAMSE